MHLHLSDFSLSKIETQTKTAPAAVLPVFNVEHCDDLDAIIPVTGSIPL